MEVTLETPRNRTQRINYYVSALKRSQPEVLENELKMMYLREMAQKLDSSVLPNDITMQEIVDEVNAVRKVGIERCDKSTEICQIFPKWHKRAGFVGRASFRIIPHSSHFHPVS